ncbi:MAG: hypothetical protein ABIS86_00830 [Streptosporangiaceae bacterium]
MTLLASLAVTLVVWAVSMIRSLRWRALVYGLPLPITVVLLATPVAVDGGQLLGLVALNAFFSVVTVVHHRLGRHIVVADLAGIAVYLALGLLTARWGPVPFWPVLGAVTVLWACVTLRLPPPHRDARAQPPPSTLLAAVKLGTVFSAALLIVALGGLLKGLIVTFPYSGVLVVLESRDQLAGFSRHFARNSISLVAYFTAYHLLQDHSQPLALTAAWAAFTAVLLTLHLPPAHHRGRGHEHA